MFREELKNISHLMNQVIENDKFPDRIEPKWLRDAVKAYPANGGKRVRPALLIWCCGLLGGEFKSAMYAAAALEIYHNWSLVHDDIIDNDDFRRGEPTTHKQLSTLAETKFVDLGKTKSDEFGKNFAILAGDIQQGWAVNMLLNSSELGVSDELTLAMSKRVQKVLNRGLISGEALDVEFSIRGWQDISSKEIETMISLKTGVLLKLCAEFGAAIALDCSDFENPQIKKLGKFALYAGMAFQLRDDWLGIFADEAKLGKPICSDIVEEKPTLLLITALENLKGDDKKRLIYFVGKKQLTQSMIEEVKALFVKSGADQIILDKANKYIEDAKIILNTFDDNKYRVLLNEFIDFLIKRNM